MRLASLKIVKFVRLTSALVLFLALHGALAQPVLSATTGPTTPLFEELSPIELEMEFSQRDLITQTDDSTYMDITMRYRLNHKDWDSIPIKVRARGNFRKENCFLAPIKLKIKKKAAKGTLFEGNKELKLVLPCYDSERGADYVLKEYLAYQMYERITPFHFKTRRFELRYTDTRRNRNREYNLQGFLIEDIDRVAERNNGHKLKRTVHPLQQDNICSIQNDFFQYMIANTDFSSAYQHNARLVFVDGRMAIPVPYDFDMSGFINTDYAVVSQIQGEELGIKKVTTRLYRGFKRDTGIYNTVRADFLSKKSALFSVLEKHRELFNRPGQYEEAHTFLQGFFEILEDDQAYRKHILAVARTQ